MKAFSQSVFVVVFDQSHIVFTDSDDKEQSFDVVEALNPFPPLRPLTADVVHPNYEVVHFELGLYHTYCSDP